MTLKRRGAWVAAIWTAALGLEAAGLAMAQTTPADPLAPGAAAEPKTEAPKTTEAPKSTDAPKAGEAAKPAKPKPKPKKETAHETGPTLAVTVNNKRSVGLVDLTVGPAGEAEPRKVAGPLAFGRKTVIHIKRTKDCLYDIRGHFADDADTEQLGVELCKDKVINLTDE